jgi:thiosulfate/3-mercaptopyruvate sulfurtransferase
MDDLISADQLARHLHETDVVVLDATYLPFEPDRDAAADFRAAHLPGARFLDLATLCDATDPLPATVPTFDQFVARMASLGVTQASRIVLYDNSPHRTSARAWWLMRVFGAREVAILDGGLAAWTASGLTTEKGAVTVQPIAVGNTGFGMRDEAMIRRLADMKAAIGEKGIQIIDARGASRFSGAEADPRPGVAPGHMPGARNLPYGRLFEADGRWKAKEAIATAFADAGVTADTPLIFTCGSGITAADLLFGAHLIGRDDTALYDGSWSEWGGDPSTPKAIGPA